MSGTVLIAVAALAVGLALGIAWSATTIWHLRRRVKELRDALNKGRETKKPETMKRLVWVCILNGFAWVWCSYVLAALDKVQIAEELSKVALVEIVAPVAVYAVKSALENLSKYNRWPDRGAPEEPPPAELPQEAENCAGEEGGGL